MLTGDVREGQSVTVTVQNDSDFAKSGSYGQSAPHHNLYLITVISFFCVLHAIQESDNTALHFGLVGEPSISAAPISHRLVL